MYCQPCCAPNCNNAGINSFFINGTRVYACIDHYRPPKKSSTSVAPLYVGFPGIWGPAAALVPPPPFPPDEEVVRRLRPHPPVGPRPAPKAIPAPQALAQAPKDAGLEPRVPIYKRCPYCLVLPFKTKGNNELVEGNVTTMIPADVIWCPKCKAHIF